MFPFQLFKESILFAFGALVQNKLRSTLSLLGITIGIFSIITVFTFIDSLQISLQKDINNLGSNVVYIQKWPWTGDENTPWWKIMNRPQPNKEEMAEVRRRCKNAEAVTFTFFTRSTIKYEDNSIDNVSITAISPEYNKVFDWVNVTQGRYFNPGEFTEGSAVTIIGADIVANLFKNGNALGQYMKVLGRKVQVVGILKKQGSSKMIGINVDESVLVPNNFEASLVNPRNMWLPRIIAAKAKPDISNTELMDELRGIMRSIRKLKPLEEDNFALNEISMINEQMNKGFGFIATLGWVIGGFAILIGGIGISNIMFVSVKERTALIGIQKSLGAKNYFILTQFIIEAITLAVLGGIVGLLIIFVATLLIGDSIGMKLILTFSNVILGLTISALIGLISGFIPAYTASQLDPVEAIRSTY